MFQVTKEISLCVDTVQSPCAKTLHPFSSFPPLFLSFDCRLLMVVAVAETV